MSISSKLQFSLSLIFFLTILTVQSVYNPYLYDDGKGGQEHCCVVPVQNSMCLAKPITRSLIQVNKECRRIEKIRRRRMEMNNQTHDEYFDKITGRLNVRKVHENDNRIYIELQTPLKKEILDNDLICLTATDQQNIMNLDKCFVELVQDEEEEYYNDDNVDDHMPIENSTQEIDDRHSEHHKYAIDNNHPKDNQTDVKNENQRIALNETVHIREGEGLSVFRKYQFDRSRIRPETRDQRRCWSWYRHRVRKLRKKSSKQLTICYQLKNHIETCIHELMSNQQQQYTQMPFTVASKLYCPNEKNQNKFLGEYQFAEVCLDQYDSITFEYKFTDIARLSDQYRNRDTLDFIGKDRKLTGEFEDDCHGKTNLIENTPDEMKHENID